MRLDFPRQYKREITKDLSTCTIGTNHGCEVPFEGSNELFPTIGFEILNLETFDAIHGVALLGWRFGAKVTAKKKSWNQISTNFISILKLYRIVDGSIAQNQGLASQIPIADFGDNDAGVETDNERLRLL